MLCGGVLQCRTEGLALPNDLTCPTFHPPCTGTVLSHIQEKKSLKSSEHGRPGIKKYCMI